jgi:heme/copper-type cytochrome/quinol oxidase subunit 1
MGRVSTTSLQTAFLQVVVALIGIGVLAALLWEPHLEGRNAHATLFEIYFRDPFLACVYVASIPFFVALYQVHRLLGFARQDRAISQEAVRATRTMKHCAFITAAAIVAAAAYLMIAARGGTDDPAGAVMLGAAGALVLLTVGSAAAVAERVLRSAMDLKAENDPGAALKPE